MAARWFISYEETSEGWRASVYTVPGCHVEGHTREEARSRVLPALLLFFDQVDPTDIEDAPNDLLSVLRKTGAQGIQSISNLIRAEAQLGEPLPNVPGNVLDPVEDEPFTGDIHDA